MSSSLTENFAFLFTSLPSVIYQISDETRYQADAGSISCVPQRPLRCHQHHSPPQNEVDDPDPGSDVDTDVGISTVSRRLFHRCLLHHFSC